MLCCFGYYQKIFKWIIDLETYFTQDVISSNLVLIILTLYSYLVQILLKYWKLCDFVVVEVSQILFGAEM